MQSETFFVSLNENNSVKDLQGSFKQFLQNRQEQFKPSKILKKSRKKNTKKKAHHNQNGIYLRELFLRQAYEYVGVPYAKRYFTEKDEEFYSNVFLDCCGLIRRVMRDLKHEFGFRLGSWNQGYMYDLLPIEYDDISEMKPGDLVFVEGVYYNEKRKPQKHNIMHVEIWVGDGEKTLGARWNRGKVQVFDSYKFVSQNYEIKRFIFKSIDTWLQGICMSFCKEHEWHCNNRLYCPGKYSIFASDHSKNDQDDEDSEPCNSTDVIDCD